MDKNTKKELQINIKLLEQEVDLIVLQIARLETEKLRIKDTEVLAALQTNIQLYYNRLNFVEQRISLIKYMLGEEIP